MINTVTVLGAGTMGRGIARFLAQNSVTTLLYDPYEAAIVSAGKTLQGITHLTCTTNLQKAVSESDLIIEAAPENIEIKRILYGHMSPFLKDQAVVASNTSTYPLSELSANQPFANRMLITHFFNPADIIPLVELVKLETTQPGLAENVALFLRNTGKVPVLLQKDINGFIANRLQAAVLREACFLVNQGVANAGDIDTVMKESIGIRWALNGPFEIADYGGLDIWKNVLTNLLPDLDNSREVPAVISRKVDEHHLGFKTGKGFFDYDLNTADEQAAARTHQLTQLLEAKKN